MGMFGSWGGNPLMAFGAGVLSGRNLGDGIARGWQMGHGLAQQEQDKKLWQDQLGQVTDPRMRQALEMAGPERGRLMYAQHLMAPPKTGPEMPWWASPDGGVHPAMKAYREMGRPQTNVNVSGGKMESEYDKEVGKKLADTFLSSQEGAATAQRSMNNLKVLDSALNDPNLYTGTGGNTVQWFKKAAGSLFGVDVRGTASGEVVQTLAKEIALNNKDKLPGPMSNSDREFLVSMAPGLGNTPEGNRLVIQLGMASKRYEIARAKAAREYAARNGGRLDSGFYDYMASVDQDYAGQFGELMDRLRAVAPRPQMAPTVGTPIDIEALKREYGLR